MGIVRNVLNGGGTLAMAAIDLVRKISGLTQGVAMQVASLMQRTMMASDKFDPLDPERKINIGDMPKISGPGPRFNYVVRATFNCEGVPAQYRTFTIKTDANYSLNQATREGRRLAENKFMRGRDTSPIDKECDVQNIEIDILNVFKRS